MQKFSRSLLISTTLLALSACSGMDGQTSSWLGTGDKDKTKALESMMGDSKVEGVNATLEKQAQASMDKGDYGRAQQFYKQLITSEKTGEADKIRYKIAYAETLRRLNKNDDALAAFDEILDEAPTNLDAQEGRGLTLMNLGKSTDAGRVFSDIMKEDGKRWRTLNALGILFVTKNMIPEAMAYYTEALKFSPDNPAVLNNVGLSQAVDKNYPRAIQALEQASRIAKSGERRRQIDLNLAMVYGASGDIDTAKEIATKYLQGPALDNNVGLYAHLAKDDALAKTYLNMALNGSNTFYERAWDNLDLVEKNTDGSPVPKKNR